MKKLSIFVYALLFIFLLAEAANADYTGTIGTRFAINGSGFGNAKSKVYLLNGSKQVQAKIENWSDSAITCLWTAKMAAGEYNLFVKPKAKGSTPIPMGTFRIMNPYIDEVNPGEFSIGNTVTIQGRFFTNKKPTVYIEDTIAAKKKKCRVLSSTMNPATGESTLQFVVPKITFEKYKITLKTQIAEVTSLKRTKLEKQQAVHPDGGIIEIDDPANPLYKTSLMVPTGALPAETNITISSVYDPPAFPGAEKNNITVDFGPDGTTFDIPAIVHIPYDPAKVTDEKKLRVFTYDREGSSWQQEKTLNIDTLNHVVTAQVSHFSGKTVQETHATLVTKLLQDSSDKLWASVVLTTPFNEMLLPATLATCSGTATVADLLALYPGEVKFKFEATLMKKNDSWFIPDTPIVTKSITYQQIRKNAPNHDKFLIKVFLGNTEWFKSWETPLWDVFFKWYSGEPALFNFQVEPENDAQYYVNVVLYLIDNIFLCEPMPTNKYEYDGSDTATDFFLPLTYKDENQDGIRDGFDRDPLSPIPPPPPTDLKVTLRAWNQLSFSWIPPDASGIVGYKVYRDDGKVIGKEVNRYFDGTHFDDSDVNPLTRYCYTVTALTNSSESEHSAQLCERTMEGPDTTIPTRPENVRLYVNSTTQMTLKWDPSTDIVGIKHYMIYRSRDGRGWGTAAADKTIYSDYYNFGRESEYCYEVQAIDNADNASLLSDKVCGSALSGPDQSPPSKPDWLDGIAYATQNVRLFWGESRDDIGVIGYRLYRDGLLVKTVDPTPNINYRIEVDDGGLRPGTRYCYTVLAIDAANNESPKSNEYCGTTKADPNPPIVYFSIPSTSESLTVTLTKFVGWDRDGTVVGYMLTETPEQPLASDLGWVTTAPMSHTFTSSGPHTLYAWAKDDSDNIGGKHATVIINVPDTTPPSVPQNLNVTAISPTQIDLSWDTATDNEKVTGYNIYKNGTLLKSVSEPPTSDTDLNPSTQYCYTITAYDAIPNESAQSIQACTTTQAVTPPPPPGSYRLPDTGQTTCYNAAGSVIACPPPGNPLAQDGSYNINPLSYTNNGNGTVTDNNTGLMWQKEDDGQTRTWEEAMSYCDSLPSLGGYSDWRLPAKKELMSIVNYGIPYPGPTIDAVFTNTKSSNYWSSTTFAYYPSYAWLVGFYGGHVDSYGKDGSYGSMYVRCVRGGQ